MQNDELYIKNAQIIFKFLMSLCRNKDIAEDLMQETFYKPIKRYNGECKITTWLCQIAKHCYLNYLKSEKRITMTILICKLFV